MGTDRFVLEVLKAIKLDRRCSGSMRSGARRMERKPWVKPLFQILSVGEYRRLHRRQFRSLYQTSIFRQQGYGALNEIVHTLRG
jgi:hypothetical protein